MIYLRCINVIELKNFLFILFIGLFGSLSIAQTTVTAVTPCVACSWNSTSSWVGGVVPGCFDNIVIPDGSEIIITATVNLGPTGQNCSPLDVFVSGTLHFQTGKKLILPTGSTFSVLSGGTVTAGGGGGNSNYIEIGTEVVWNAGQGDITVPITLCEGCSQLAVLLIEFKAKQNGRDINLFWSTSSEENNDYFTIERSSENSSWKQIALIDGEGTTSQSQFYTYQDTPDKDGIYYYRLYQTDLDGTREMLGEVSVNYMSDIYVVKRVDLLGNEVQGEPQGLVIEILSDNSARKVYYGR